jgi:peptidoglycan hydrolase-like protein with peptidoglycan-binding domain
VVRFAVALVAIGGIALGVALVLDRMVTPGELEESLAPVESPPVTVKVEQRVIATTLIGRGQVAYEDEDRIALSSMPGLDGSIPLLTWLPERSTELQAGDVLAEVAYRPVILLQGEAPLVRDLTLGESGPDVGTLQRALVSVGLLTESDIDNNLGLVTSRAVAALYEAAGYPAPRRADALYAPAAEIHLTTALPLVVREVTGRVGDAVAPGSDILTVSSPTAHLVVALPSFEAALLAGGETAEIVDDATSNTTSGRVLHVGTVPDPEAGGVPVIVAFDGALPDDRDYRVTIEIETTGQPVLAVPETALYLGSGDSPYVLRTADGGGSEPIPVKVGIVGSDGYAQITPVTATRLLAGDHVVVGAER